MGDQRAGRHGISGDNIQGNRRARKQLSRESGPEHQEGVKPYGLLLGKPQINRDWDGKSEQLRRDHRPNNVNFKLLLFVASESFSTHRQ